jgi:peptide-methionine (R)-S-oxide reductase
MGTRIIFAGVMGLALTGVVFKGESAVTEEHWKAKLDSTAYCVLRDKGTEQPFTGKYWNHHEKGTYLCGGCGTPLFLSDTKYNSGSGWPSFWQPIDSVRLHFEKDTAWGMSRIEVTCAKCGGHLGHVFEDGPKPTGKRFCINSASLNFQSDK